MALLEDCFFCSLSVAASVIGVYTLVAYVIAFFLETWWIVNTPVSLPSPAYVLCAGYLIVFVFSGILLRGLSIKNTLFLLEWLLVVAALSVPEGVLVYFMSIHYWNIRSLYGLMELTCWVCRAIVNVSGMICVQSLYSTWREEKEVLRRLRDLNMTRVVPSRRSSVSSQANGFAKSPPVYPSAAPPQLLNNGAFLPTLRRSSSMVSVLSRPQSPGVLVGGQLPFLAMPAPLGPAMSEFNASQFDLSLQSIAGPPQPLPQVSKAHSLLDLRSVVDMPQPRKTMSVVDFPIEKKLPIQTQSLDRRILKSNFGMKLPPPLEGLYATGRLKNAYYPPFRNGDSSLGYSPEMIYGRNINSFYPGKSNSRSKHSVGSDSDDFQKYRDIAL